MLSWVEHEKKKYNLGACMIMPVCLALCVKFSADNILKYFFPFYPENRELTFHANCLQCKLSPNGENLREMSNPIIWEQLEK